MSPYWLKEFFFLILIMQVGIIFCIEYHDYLMYNLRQLQNGIKLFLRLPTESNETYIHTYTECRWYASGHTHKAAWYRVHSLFKTLNLLTFWLSNPIGKQVELTMKEETRNNLSFTIQLLSFVSLFFLTRQYRVGLEGLISLNIWDRLALKHEQSN